MIDFSENANQRVICQAVGVPSLETRARSEKRLGGERYESFHWVKLVGTLLPQTQCKFLHLKVAYVHPDTVELVFSLCYYFLSFLQYKYSLLLWVNLQTLKTVFLISQKVRKSLEKENLQDDTWFIRDTKMSGNIKTCSTMRSLWVAIDRNSRVIPAWYTPLCLGRTFWDCIIVSISFY